MDTISGFSKLSKVEKIAWLKTQVTSETIQSLSELENFWLKDSQAQQVFDEFSENTLSNYYLPFGVAPNFLIDGKVYAIPMVIEESSVVAAASKAAKFWLKRGGFKTRIKSETKVGQVHFEWQGNFEHLQKLFSASKESLLQHVSPITENMHKRGGGLLELELIDRRESIENYYQLKATFNTCDAMGANFINTVLEALAQKWQEVIEQDQKYLAIKERNVSIIMSILSNYNPGCVVEATVSCSLEELGEVSGMPAEAFAQKFVKAVQIAREDISRAVTHNKGIFNGIDAVVLATGNDFRAIEACGHAYAARDGQYRSLSQAKIVDGFFMFTLEVPLALGTVGGLTKLHPLVRLSLRLLESPSAAQLMSIVAAVGLSQNFAAIKSLVTTGIQKGHMKMHLLNILNQLEASDEEREEAKKYFQTRVVSFTGVRDFIHQKRMH